MPASRMWPGWRLAGTSPGRSSVPSISRASCCTGVADSPSVQPSAAEAARWLAKAEEDLAVAQLLVQSDSPVRWAACFHSQQAAEKAIKSLLVLAGVDFPRSHALGRLVALLPAGPQSCFDDEARRPGAMGDCGPLSRRH